MNSYSNILKTACVEIDAYSKTKDGESWGEMWFQGLKELVTVIITAESDEEAELSISTISHRLFDSGPTANSLSPSIEIVIDAFQRKSKRR